MNERTVSKGVALMDTTRPISVYDNLSARDHLHTLQSAVTSPSPSPPPSPLPPLIDEMPPPRMAPQKLPRRSLPFSDIQFKFDDTGDTAHDPQRSIQRTRTASPKIDDKYVMSDAKSSFFGLNNRTENVMGGGGAKTAALAATPFSANSNSAVDQRDYSRNGGGGGSSFDANDTDRVESKHNFIPQTVDGNGDRDNHRDAMPPPDAYADDDDDADGDETQGGGSLLGRTLAVLPSQAIYLATTVPQNLKSNDIAGRHTPTRNSLRHSRMLMIKNYQGGQRSNQLGTNCLTCITMALVLAVIAGIVLCTIGIWLLLWTPHLRTYDQPYSSGIMLFLAGILGLYVTHFKRSTQAAVTVARHRIFKCLRLNFYIVLACAIVVAAINLTGAALHLSGIVNSLMVANSEKCIADNLLMVKESACLCAPANASVTSDHRPLLLLPQLNDAQQRQDDMVATDCDDLIDWWRLIVAVSTVFNFIGLITAAVLAFILCAVARKSKTYATVRSSDNNNH